MRILIVVSIAMGVVSYFASTESLKLKAMQTTIDTQKECIQNVKNSRDKSFDPGPLGYSICDIDPFHRPCPCSEVE